MLAEAVDSVRKQSLQNLEILIIDDCSPNSEIEDLIKSIPDERIKYFRNEKNSGQEYSRMNGLRHARGKYIVFIDDDDFYTDYNFFAKAVKIHEDEKFSFVSANAKSINLETGSEILSDIGQPGRVKGLDYILLNGKKYYKPFSTFPTVFNADILRRAGLESMIIFDAMTYMQAALLGDAYFMADVVGVYRIHGESTTLGYKNKNYEREEKYYYRVGEHLKRWLLVKNALQGRADEKEINSWYFSSMEAVTLYHEIARPGFSDRLKVYRMIIKQSGFMPKLRIKLFCHIIKDFIREQRRKITRPIKNFISNVRAKDAQ